MNIKWLYLFWSGMDLLYVGRFCYLGFSQGRIPFYSDIQSFFLLSTEHSSVSILLFWLSLVLNVSIIFSMLLFFCNSSRVLYIVYVQTPLRLLLAVPSIPFLLWFAKTSGATSATLLFVLLLLSEIIKLCSFYFRGEACSGLK